MRTSISCGPMARGAGLALCLGVLATAKPSVAAADPTPAVAGSPEQRGVFTLYVNEVRNAEVTAVLRGDDIFLRRKDLEDAGLHDFTATEQSAGGEPRLL